MYKSFPLLFFLVITFFSCKKEEVFTETSDPLIDVESALKPYFVRFTTEAKARGIAVELSDHPLTGIISDIPTSQVIGQCSYSNDTPYKVTIDKPFWDKASDLGREFVVFHELGHCVLGRAHDESMDSRGFCLSIMRSGTGTCRDSYNTTTRKALLDELFSE